MLNNSALDFHRSTHHPYYILAPDYRQTSAGVRVLHYLCHALNEAGYEAYLTATVCNPYLRTPRLDNAVIKWHALDDRLPIIVYPEVASGNPLDGEVVVRWLLNKPGHIGGDREFPPDDLLFFWDYWILDGKIKAERLWLPAVDTRIFNNLDNPNDRKRRGFCYYAHKYILLFGGKVDRQLIEHGTRLCQDIPRSPKEIAQILRTAEVLYCYEPSAIVQEAYSCGCPVIYIANDYLDTFDNSQAGSDFLRIDAADIGNFPIPAFDSAAFVERIARERVYALQLLDNFIAITQRAAREKSPPEKKNERLLNRAIRAYRAADNAGATEFFSALLKNTPEDPLPYAYLSCICAARGLDREADEFIGKALQLAPEHATAFKTALGEAFLNAGNPDAAASHFDEIITDQPDWLPAYPLLARSLHLTQKSEAAVALLQGVARIPSPAQDDIHAALLDILAAQGDVAGFAENCLRFSRGVADDLRAVCSLACLETGGERLVETLGRVQAQLIDACLAAETVPTPPPPRLAGAPPTVAFLVGDFAREAHLERLAPLLFHLPAERFITALIVNDMNPVGDYAQTCLSAAGQTLSIASLDDDAALAKIDGLAPDILVDLDAYGPGARLPVFLRARAGRKLQWSEAPLPAITPASTPIVGAYLARSFPLPALTLPQLGEYRDLPDLPIAAPAAPASRVSVFGCLTPAAQIGPEGWQLFAQVLHACPESRLVVNLHDLSFAAQNFVGARFAAAGITAERLEFVHAETAAELCALWQTIDFGLAPPAGSGDLALAACLWMGRPYAALAPTLPWSARPAALAAAAGAEAWIAETPEDYVALAAAAPRKTFPAFRDALRATGLTDPAAFARGFAASILGRCPKPRRGE